MNIAFLSPHVKVSGGVKVILRLAKELGDRGHKVSVCVYNYNPAQLPSFYKTNNSFEFVNLEVKPIPADTELIINFGDNIIDPRYKGIPTILFLQGFGTQNLEMEIKALVAKYSCIVATSPWLAKLAKAVGHKNIHIASPGVDEVFTPKEVRPTYLKNIGCLYHDHPSKNFSLFTLSMYKLYKKHGKLVNSVLLSSKPVYGVEPFVELNFPYTVYIKPAQEVIPYIYSSCFAWVSTSVNEGWSLPALEALSCGCPLLWIPSRGLEHVLVHRENCMVVYNKNEISDAILELMKDPELYKKLSIEGRRTATQFTWKSCIDNFLKAIKSI